MTDRSGLVVWREGVRFRVLAARVDRPRDLRRRMLGLLVRPPLKDEEALWLDPCGGIHTWGMRYDIDVLFLSADRTVLRVARCVSPWKMVFAPRGTRSVLELRSGEAESVFAGDVIESE